MEATISGQQRKAAVNAVLAISEAIRELGSVPSGHLYARVMGHMSLQSYEGIIRILKNAGLVSESANLLIWVEPQIH